MKVTCLHFILFRHIRIFEWKLLVCILCFLYFFLCVKSFCKKKKSETILNDLIYSTTMGEHPPPHAPSPHIMGNPASGSHHLIKKFPTAKFTIPAPLKKYLENLAYSLLTLIMHYHCWFGFHKNANGPFTLTEKHKVGLTHQSMKQNQEIKSNYLSGPLLLRRNRYAFSIT